MNSHRRFPHWFLSFRSAFELRIINTYKLNKVDIFIEEQLNGPTTESMTFPWFSLGEFRPQAYGDQSNSWPIFNVSFTSARVQKMSFLN